MRRIGDVRIVIKRCDIADLKKTIISAVGDIRFKRNTYECVHCQYRAFIADEAVIGNISKLTKGARKLITLAGASWGFRNAADKLKIFTGLNVSYNTLRQYTYREAKNFKKTLTTRSKAQEKFIKASGVTELMTDGTLVNTTNGWKEIRLIQASKRLLGDYSNADTFSTRHLSKPTVVYCIGYLESAKHFASRWPSFAKILHIHNFSELHFISDGAGWIWKACQKYFPNCQGCLDYYHGCEHISQCTEELFKDKAQKQEFYESCRLAMLREGWEGIKGVIE